MSSKIKQKRSAVPGKIPLPEQMDAGELAINTADIILYTKAANGNVVVINDWNNIVNRPDGLDAMPYDIVSFYHGTPDQNESILNFKAPRGFVIESDQTNGSVVVSTAPAANVSFDIAKNGVTIGSAAVLAAQTTGTVTIAVDTAFVPGDVFAITYSSADTTVAGISIVLEAYA